MVDQDGFCTECGAAVSSTDKFCAGCGHNLGGTPASPTSPPPQAPQAPQRNPIFPLWSWLVLLGAVLGFMMLSQCSGDDASSPTQETRAATTKAPTTTLAFWRAALDRSDPTIMISVDRWIGAELCEELVGFIRQIEDAYVRADPSEVRVWTEFARYIFEGVEANVYIPGYECDERGDFVALREEWSERLGAAD